MIYRKILIADDDPNISVYFAETAKLMGFEAVESVSNGLEALKKYKTSRPDVVLMDLDMPVMDGYTSSREIRRFDPDAKIIVVTGDAGSAIAHKIIKEGHVNMLLQKPVNMSSLIKSIEEVMT